MNLVFSYGSNSIAQLRARVENPNLLAEPAKAQDWQRIFCVRTTTWGGAAASLIPYKGSVTYGAVVTLTDEELARLDRFEGGYHKEELGVDILRNDKWVTMHAIVYLANAVFWTELPSEAYLSAIHINLREQFGETMPHIANNIDIYGVFSSTECDDSVHSQKNTIGFSDSCSGYGHVSSVQDIDLSTVRVARISQWSYPGPHALTLPALCVEVNAARESKWVMPRAVAGVTQELSLFGILSVSHLAARLTSGWHFQDIDGDTKTQLEYLDTEALVLFSRLLFG